MTKRSIFITEFDKDRLEMLIGGAKASADRTRGDARPPQNRPLAKSGAKASADRTRGDLVGLASELAQALVVPSSDVPRSVVTMNSKVLMRDLETSEEKDVREHAS